MATSRTNPGELRKEAHGPAICWPERRPPDYCRRTPEDTVLYQAVRWNLETFLASRREQDRPIPAFAERELRAFLDCGILACGFARLRCQDCGVDRLVGFSCKGRAVCSSCCGRRMADTAAHLVDRVFPQVPVRQWVLSVPHRLRYLMAWDSDLITTVYGVFTRAVFGHLQRKAVQEGKDGGGRAELEHAQCGAVSFVQRFGSSLNLHVHLHMIAIDGVYVRPSPEGPPRFVRVSAPTDEEVGEVARTLAKRLHRLIDRRNGNVEEGAEDPVAQAAPGLADVYAASIQGKVAAGPRTGQRLKRGGDRVEVDRPPEATTPRCAAIDGVSLHANVYVPAGDRDRLERLARYAARPPLSEDRLDGLPDGRLVYIFKRPWRDGTDRAIFEPEDFLARLAALVPKPRAHVIRFSGILAPAAAWRAEVVPGYSKGAQNPPASEGRDNTEQNPPSSAPSVDEERRRPRRNYLWSELMKRVFAVDVLGCPRCGGRFRLIAFIHGGETARKILDCLGLPSRAPPPIPARRPANPTN